MPGKITDLASNSAAATGDLIETVDVSDTSMAATGTNKKLTLADFVTWLLANGVGGGSSGYKVTELTALTGAGAATGDLIEVVDISDTTMAGSGTNKKMTLAEFAAAMATINNLAQYLTSATAASTYAALARTITGTGALSGGGDLSANRTLDVATAGVTLAKLANLAQDQFIGRVTASTGVPETATITAAARTVLDDTTVAAMLATLGGGPIRRTIKADTTTAYAPITTDENQMVTLSNASAITVSVPSNATQAFPIGAEVDFLWLGVGQPTFAAGSGASINATPGLKMRAQYSAATAKKISTNGWVILGDLST